MGDERGCPMPVTGFDVHWDMYDRDLYASPYETFRRMRNEAPVYYNEQYGFYALSRHDDVLRVLNDRETFISGKGIVYNTIIQDRPLPSGLFINEDPPMHTIHRAIVSRLFTPKAVAGLEPEIQRLSTEIVEALEGRERFDFMRDFAEQLPIQVIGMLVGVPREDQPTLLATAQKSMHEGSANPNHHVTDGIRAASVFFNEYLDWREKHPSDDVMTQLMRFEFEDETGTTRTLRRDEILNYLSLINSAGAETTATAIAWAGSLLSEHPDQRRELVADPGLMAHAVEEILRYEPPSYHFCRWSTAPTEFHGVTIPAESIVVVLPPAANRDEAKWDDPERFDIHRTPGQIFTFSFGAHFCLGANLAKVEARILLDTLLRRIPEWTVDHDAATLTKGIDTRGWESLPVLV